MRLRFIEIIKTDYMIKKYYPSILLFFATVLLLSLGSCDPAKKYEKAETEAIANYLNSHVADTFIKEQSGLYYRDVLVGTGSTPIAHDTVDIVYTGKFLDGSQFTTNVGGADLVFPVAEGLAIAGIDEGITYMKVGGKATFLIPSALGYGPTGYGIISGYTPLLYDIQLVKVIPGPGK